MKTSGWGYYLWMGAFGIGCFVVATWLPTEPFLKGMVATPGVVSLLGVAFLIIRDHNDYLRKLDFQNKKNDFDLAVASHMANQVFDKHSVFCDEYLSEMNKGIRELVARGPHKETIKITIALSNIRQKHTAWLTKEIDSQLSQVEYALQLISADEHYLDHLPVGDKRKEVVESAYKKFKTLLSIKEPEDTSKTTHEKEVAFADILDFLRSLLGVNELTALRQQVVKSAVSRVNP